MEGPDIRVLEEKHMISILLHLLDNDGCTKTDLYDAVSSNPRMPRKLDALEDSGLVTQTPVPDSRTVRIGLTDLGITVGRSLREAEAAMKDRRGPQTETAYRRLPLPNPSNNYLYHPIRLHPMTTEDVRNKLLSTDGVKLAFIPDEETIRSIFEQEDVIMDTTFGMPLDNRALKACMERDGHIIVFSTYAFETPTEHVMTMEDDDGNLVGFDIPHGKESEYQDDENLMWLCDDFVLRTDGEATKVVMLPQSTGCIGCEEGVCDAVIFYPATTTDQYLREKYGVDMMDSNIASAMVSFRIV